MTDIPGKLRRSEGAALVCVAPTPTTESVPGKRTSTEHLASGWAGNLARSWEASYHETTRILEEWAVVASTRELIESHREPNIEPAR